MEEQVHIPHPWIKERAKTGPRLRKHVVLGFNDRLAVFITSKFGTMGAFYVLVIWNIVWIFLATLGVGVFKLDPYPFTFLLFLSNLVQLFALPVLAVGQQILGRTSDKQAELTYKDAEAILKLQDEVHRLVKINNQLTAEIHKATMQKKEVRRVKPVPRRASVEKVR
jgi:uncharacterized membrane protein